MPKTKFNFIIDYQIYPFDLMVSIGESFEELKRKVHHRVLEEDIPVFADFNCEGLGHTMILMKTGATILWVRKYEKTPEWRASLAHEVCHAAQFLMHRIGITHSNDSLEAYAYLRGYITKKIYEKIK
jgi:hypothetical protein